MSNSSARKHSQQSLIHPKNKETPYRGSTNNANIVFVFLFYSKIRKTSNEAATSSKSLPNTHPKSEGSTVKRQISFNIPDENDNQVYSWMPPGLSPQKVSFTPLSDTISLCPFWRAITLKCVEIETRIDAEFDRKSILVECSF